MNRIITVCLLVWSCSLWAEAQIKTVAEAQIKTAAEAESKIVDDYIDWIRTIQPSKDLVETQMTLSKMNAIWGIFSSDQNAYRAILRKKLDNELKSTSIRTNSQLISLELALYLAYQYNPIDNDLIERTIRSLDINDPIIDHCSFLYYQLLTVYSTGSPNNFLPLLDQLLLPNESNAFQVHLPTSTSNIEIYQLHAFGVYGLDVNDYLLSQLEKGMNSERQETILRILKYTCTQRCSQPVFDYVKHGIDLKSLVHATYILLDLGGPTGRDLFLQIPVTNFKGKSSDWLKSEKGYAKRLTFENLLAKFEKEHVKDNRVYTKTHFNKLLDTMVTDPNLFLSSHPHDFTNSELSANSLIEKLLQIRKTLFNIVNAHGRDYIIQANEILNAMYFRDMDTQCAGCQFATIKNREIN